MTGGLAYVMFIQRVYDGVSLQFHFLWFVSGHVRCALGKAHLNCSVPFASQTEQGTKTNNLHQESALSFRDVFIRCKVLMVFLISTVVILDSSDSDLGTLAH